MIQCVLVASSNFYFMQFLSLWILKINDATLVCKNTDIFLIFSSNIVNICVSKVTDKVKDNAMLVGKCNNFNFNKICINGMYLFIVVLNVRNFSPYRDLNTLNYSKVAGV